MDGGKGSAFQVKGNISCRLHAEDLEGEVLLHVRQSEVWEDCALIAVIAQRLVELAFLIPQRSLDLAFQV